MITLRLHVIKKKSDYRLHPITWKNVIDYNWLRLQLQLPHVWFECALEMIAEANFWQAFSPVS